MMRSVGGQAEGIPVKAVAKEGFREETGSGQALQSGKDREDGGMGAAMQGAEAPPGCHEGDARCDWCYLQWVFLCYVGVTDLNLDSWLQVRVMCATDRWKY